MPTNNIKWKLRGGGWGRRDSNPHALRHMILSHARLPITTLPRRALLYAIQRKKGNYQTIGITPHPAFRTPHSSGVPGERAQSLLHLAHRGAGFVLDRVAARHFLVRVIRVGGQRSHLYTALDIGF